MIRCYKCGTDNLDGSEFCDECGNRLTSNTGGSGFAVPPPPLFLNKQEEAPKAATPFIPPPAINHNAPTNYYPGTGSGPIGQAGSVGQTGSGATGPTISQDFSGELSGLNYSAPSHRFTAEPPQVVLSGELINGSHNGIHIPQLGNARLIIQRGGQIGKEFTLTIPESMIGRWDADGGIFPEVDLDQDDPEAKISRRHAKIQFQNNQYMIEDLGSTNGTFINRGPRLLPGNKQPLTNGDEIIVGKTFLKFVIS